MEEFEVTDSASTDLTVNHFQRSNKFRKLILESPLLCTNQDLLLGCFSLAPIVTYFWTCLNVPIISLHFQFSACGRRRRDCK